MDSVEKRRGERLLCAGLVEVRWTDAFEGECKTIANLEDLSPGGVSLLVDRPLPRCLRVEFSHSGHLVSGAVRHCTSTDAGWIVGLRFLSDSQWDPGANPPGHLLDPNSIPEDAQLRRGPHLPQGIRSTISCLVLGDAIRCEEK